MSKIVFKTFNVRYKTEIVINDNYNDNNGNNNERNNNDNNKNITYN